MLFRSVHWFRIFSTQKSSTYDDKNIRGNVSETPAKTTTHKSHVRQTDGICCDLGSDTEWEREHDKRAKIAEEEGGAESADRLEGGRGGGPRRGDGFCCF